jgi:hypothetical protein
MSLLQPIQAAMGQGGWGNQMVFHGIEAASQSYKIGAPLVNSSGSLVEASANPTAIIGVALAAATGVTAADIPFMPAVQDSAYFLISIDKASGQAGASAKLAQTNVYATYGITKDSTTGFWYLDVDKSGSNQKVMVMGFPTSNGVGVINGQCYVMFLRASTTVYV